jgi:hypothetical protein
MASKVDTVGHRRFSGALNAPGAGNGSLSSRPVALILMGDWRVPAGYDSQMTKTGVRTAGNDRRDRRYQAFGPRREESLREFFRLTGRGLTQPSHFGEIFEQQPAVARTPRPFSVQDGV